MTDTEIFTRAYLEALYFTDTGEEGQPAADAELTPFYKAKAWNECRNFWLAYGPLIRGSDASVEQAGHDLWLTRGGHGVGYWDRPDLYGERLAAELTRAAQAMGSTDPDFQDQPKEQLFN